MFTVKVENNIIEHSKSIVEKHDFGQRYTANGSKEQQVTGIIGQSVIMQLFDLGYVDGKSGFDDGVDFVFANKKIDVKTMGRTTDVNKGYTNNFLKLQDYFKTEIYVFCSYHKIKNELTVCGWITKDDLISKRRFYPKGSTRTRLDKSTFETFADLYEIDNKDLNDIKSIQDLKEQLVSLK